MRRHGTSCGGVMASIVIGLFGLLTLVESSSAFVRLYPTTTQHPQRHQATYPPNHPNLVLYHQHAPHEEERATLGDIMSSVAVGEGLVTASSSSQSSSLAELYGIHHPLDRMALTANGNLQRMVSSYYDAPVSVLVESCVLQNDSNSTTSSSSSNTTTLDTTTTTTQPQRWHRVVHLQIFNTTTFCTATSDITIYDPTCQELVASHQIGLGQLFRHLDILPSFELHQAGKTTVENKGPHSTPHASSGGGGFWRTYTLHCAALSCHIHEEFCPGMWELNNGEQP